MKRDPDMPKIGCVQHDCAECAARAKPVNGQPEMVYVEWIDSSRSEGWCTQREIENARTAMECRTVGFLVHEDERAIVLAHSASHKDAGSPFCSLMTIPKVAVTLRATAQAFYADVLPKHTFPEEKG